jgi:hypothetical protein
LKRFRLLVCGGRDFSDKDFVYETLDKIHEETPISAIIQGDAEGADKLASDWADYESVSNWKFPANWERYKKSAGPIRNAEMLKIAKPHKVLAFPGGNGTNHMVKIAKAAGISVIDKR